MPASSAPRNGALWLDNHGLHVNAHGGGVLWHGDRYWWFGEHKVAGPAGNAAHVGVHGYSSPDLCTWTDEGIALAVDDDPAGELARGCILERPKVLYCAGTGEFVMWFHLEPKGQGYAGARSGVAVSQRPAGPYRYLGSFRPNAGHWPRNATADDRRPVSPAQAQARFSGGNSPDNPVGINILGRDFAGGQMARDMNLFLDDDGRAYHVHAAEENQTTQLSLLTADFRQTSGQYVRLFPRRYMEAPCLCRRGQRYYFLASGCTGWAPNAARAAVADSIWGPWTELPNPCLGSNPDNGLGPESTFGGQSTCIFKLHDRDLYLAMFDLWRPQDAIDGRYAWLPIRFTDQGFEIAWQETWAG